MHILLKLASDHGIIDLFFHFNILSSHIPCSINKLMIILNYFREKNFCEILALPKNILDDFTERLDFVRVDKLLVCIKITGNLNE